MKRWVIILMALAIALAMAQAAWAQEGVLRLPTLSLGVEEATSPEQVNTALQVVFLLTILTLAPAILVMTTSFTRLAVVFGLLRNALGTQQMPPAQIVVGLSLFLTFFIMAPVFNQVHDEALAPYMDGKLNQEQFFEKATSPMREFMLKQTRKKDLGLFMRIAGDKKPQNAEDVPLTSLVPAFVISELKTAFTIGFLLYVPFLVIDMVVASVLLSMGMMMLPPVMVSLPFKLMLFVLVDGWHLIVGSMVQSFF
ncbi:MAG: flagellar type III secretion system pore protein FliP [Desulfarculaceae bacterium]|jgi:flagellar biosynthetic protein FliP